MVSKKITDRQFSKIDNEPLTMCWRWKNASSGRFPVAADDADDDFHPRV